MDMGNMGDGPKVPPKELLEMLLKREVDKSILVSATRGINECLGIFADTFKDMAILLKGMSGDAAGLGTGSVRLVREEGKRPSIHVDPSGDKSPYYILEWDDEDKPATTVTKWERTIWKGKATKIEVGGECPPEEDPRGEEDHMPW